MVEVTGLLRNCKLKLELYLLKPETLLVLLSIAYHLFEGIKKEKKKACVSLTPVITIVF